MSRDVDESETQQWSLIDSETGELILQMDVLRAGNQVLYVDTSSIEANEHSDVSRDIFGGDLLDD